ncbi:MAG: hypothetical protein EA370_04005 [Wenzhouxiangella sp.]|nr:MAG: hypothetical protein EA370_04005 [Wenzhouxiangella sp.]
MLIRAVILRLSLALCLVVAGMPALAGGQGIEAEANNPNPQTQAEAPGCPFHAAKQAPADPVESDPPDSDACCGLACQCPCAGLQLLVHRSAHQAHSPPAVARLARDTPLPESLAPSSPLRPPQS